MACLAVSWIDVFQTARFRYIRPSIFAGMGLSGVLPVLHSAFLYPHVSEVSRGLVGVCLREWPCRGCCMAVWRVGLCVGWADLRVGWEWNARLVGEVLRQL